MTEERRSAPRARISGARVTYESAAGDHVETDALNIGRGGLFVAAAKPLAVGKRISLEIQMAGEAGPWSALGRIVWVRQDADGTQQPSGMGVKLIDVEDAMVAAIDRLVQVRQAAEQADVARAAGGGLKREPTMLGVGSLKEAAPAVPIVAVAPRERTILGVGTDSPTEASEWDEPSPQRASSPPHKPAAAREPSGVREPSVVIDLVDSEKKGSTPPGESATPREVSARTEVPAVAKRRKGGRWFLVLVFLLLAAAAAYALMGTDLERLQRLTGEPPPTPPPSPTTTVTPQPSAAPTIVSWPTASPTVSTTPAGHASASSTPMATTPATGHSATANSPGSELPEPKKAWPNPAKPPAKRPPPPEDNPY